MSQPSHSPAPTTTFTDPAEVFQKAFWKRPTPEDRILKAERREWADKAGLSKWQWRLTVQPSTALVDHLITHNAFLLTRTEKLLPEGFPVPTAGSQHFTNPAGTFHLLWSPKENLLYATDSGSGFRPAAPEPVRAIVASPPGGRLPTTLPPSPR